MTTSVIWPSLHRLWRSEGSGGILLRGSLSSFVVGGFAVVAAVLVQILLTRLLGAEIWGRYSYALSWVNFLALFGALGCETLAIRFVSSYHGAKDLSRLAGVVSWGLRVPLLASLGISALMLATLGLAPRLHDQPARVALMVGALLLPAVVILKMTAAVLKGLRRIVSGIAIQGIVRPLLIGAVVLAFWLLQGRTAPAAGLVMAVNVVVTLGVAAGSVMIVRGQLAGSLAAVTPVEEGATWLRNAGPHFMISASQTLLHYSDAIMVGALIGTRDAGIYNIVIQVTTLIGFGVTAVNTVVAPLIGERHGQGRTGETRRIVRLASLGMTAYAVVVGLVLVLLRRPLLGLFGPSFVEGADTLLVMVGGQLMAAVFGPIGFFMTMTGHARIASRYIAISAMANVGLNAVLIPRYGMMGAAWATAAAITMRGIMLAIWYRVNAGFRQTQEGR